MVRRLLLTTLLVFLTVVLPGLPAVAAAGEAPVVRDEGWSMMWTVVPKKAKDPSPKVWLLGSVHLGTKEMYPLPAPVEAAFVDAELLSVELDSVHLDKAAAATVMMGFARSASRRPWTEKAGDALVQRLMPITAALGIPAEDVPDIDPWFFAFLAVQTGAKASGLDVIEGTDNHLLQRAREGQRIEEIEGIAAQLEVMDKLPLAVQLEMLRQSLDPEGRDSFRLLVAAWIAGDIVTLEKVAMDLGSSREGRALKNAMFTQRNKGMAKYVEGLFRGQDDALVVVGAGHLIGSDGIAALLRRKGYVVERVKRLP